MPPSLCCCRIQEGKYESCIACVLRFRHERHTDGHDWPQDANRTNFVAKILRENGFESEGLEVARKAVKINPENVESWREFSKFTSITISEKSLAEKKIIGLDPLGFHP